MIRQGHKSPTTETISLIEIKILNEQWSPEQVSGWLANSGMQSVSPEWIYQYILTNKKAGGDLHAYLRCQKKRKKRYGSPDKPGHLRNRVSIDEPPLALLTNASVWVIKIWT